MRELKKRLKMEADLFVNDRREEIKRRIVLPTYVPQPKRSGRLIMALKPVLALGCLAIILTLVLPFLIPGEEPHYTEVSNSVITIDINPSIEIETNPNDIIVSYRALNSDAALLLEGASLQGQNVYDGCLAIINLAKINGYVNPSFSNDIVITTVNDNGTHEENVYQNLVNKIGLYYTEEGLQGNISRAEISEEIRQEANEMGISAGKLSKVKAAMAVDSSLSMEQALKMPIRDLNNIINHYDNKTENFLSDYHKRLDELISEKTSDNEARRNEHHQTKARLEDYSDALTDLDTHKGSMTNHGYQRVLNGLIRNYLALQSDYPEDLPEVTDEVTLEELMAITEQFNLKIIQEIAQETQSIVGNTASLTEKYKEKVKQNLNQHSENPLDIDLSDLD